MDKKLIKFINDSFDYLNLSQKPSEVEYSFLLWCQGLWQCQGLSSILKRSKLSQVDAQFIAERWETLQTLI